MNYFFLVFFSIFLLSSSMAAEPGQEETLEPVVVTATRLKDVEEKISRVAGKVAVITKEDINNLGAKTIQEVLQHQSGVVLYDLIGNEFQSAVDLRGFNAQPVPATTVFVDGVRVNEPDFNTINFDLIPIEDVEKIEILYGPGTVFGRNSLAGVIHITTKRGERGSPRFEVEIGGGSYARQKYTFNTSGSLPLADADYYFGVTRELTDGYRDDSESRITRIFTKLGYRVGPKTDVALSYTRVNDRLKQAGSLTREELRRNRRQNPTSGDFSDGDLHLVALNLRQKLPRGFSLVANGFFRDNSNKSFVIGRTSVSNARFDFRQGGGALQLSHEGSIFNRQNSLNLGVEYGRNIFSNRTNASFSGFPFRANNAAEEDVVGIYFVETLDIFKSLTVTGGFRYDWDRINFADRVTRALSFRKTFNRLTPRAGVAYNPFPHLGFYFSYAEGFRTPTVAEFPAFEPPTFAPSVTDLDPVKSRSFEVGVRGNWNSWLEGSVAFFYMPVRDEILFVVTDPATFSGRNDNIKRTLRRGVEVTLKSRYRQWIDGFLNYSFTKATFETDVLLFSGQVKKGDDFPLVPRHRVGVGVNIRPAEGFTLSLTGTYVGSQFLLNDEPNRFKKLDQYFALNGKLSYDWKNFTGYITVNNLTNEKYSTFGILGAEPFFNPAPGINVFAGLTFRR